MPETKLRNYITVQRHVAELCAIVRDATSAQRRKQQQNSQQIERNTPSGNEQQTSESAPDGKSVAANGDNWSVAEKRAKLSADIKAEVDDDEIVCLDA